MKRNNILFSDGCYRNNEQIEGLEQFEETSSEDILSQTNNMDRQDEARVNIVPNSTIVEEQTHSPTKIGKGETK